MPAPAYDAENHLISAAGQTYLYDGDGQRVEKASGSPLTANKLYWYDQQGNAIYETDASGHELYRYFRFAGLLVAREEANDWVDHYGLDALGNVRWLYSYSGAWDIIDYYPFGGQRVLQSNSTNSRKFTGKERDSESDLDNFGARYYSSPMGRFTSVDPIWVKIDRLVDPQRLNLYAYGRNNPLVFVDPDGEDVTIGRCSIGSAQDCFKQLQSGLTKEDWEHVKLVTGDGKNGCDKGGVLRCCRRRLQERLQELSGTPDARQ